VKLPSLSSVSSESLTFVFITLCFISRYIPLCSLGYEANPDGIDDCQKLFDAGNGADDSEGEEGEVGEVDRDLDRVHQRPDGAEETGQGLGQGHLSENKSSGDGEGDGEGESMQNKRGVEGDTCQDGIGTGGGIGPSNIIDGDIDDDAYDADDSGCSSSGAVSVSVQSICDISCQLVKVSV
jgi:hypothetical protein